MTELYSFDHDMGSFVATGTATVSEDGMVIRSDPGTGIIKGGWHCGGNPATAGTAADCPECQICDGVSCVENPVTRPCDDHDGCTVRDRCQPPGRCAGDKIEIKSVTATANNKARLVITPNKAINFRMTAVQENCTTLKYRWNFGDGSAPVQTQNAQHTYTQVGRYAVTAEVRCEECAAALKTGAVDVNVFRVVITQPSQPQAVVIAANGTNIDPPPIPAAEARIEGIDPDPTAQTSFEWTVETRLPRGTCVRQPNDVNGPDIQMTTIGGTLPEGPARIIGGQVTYAVKVTIDGEQSEYRTRNGTGPMIDVRIEGQNPTRAAVAEMLPHNTLRRVACHESGMRQFDAPPGNTILCPLFSRDNLGGVGIMQLTVPAPTLAQHWDWILNVFGGMAKFADSQRVATGYPARVQATQPFQAAVNAINTARQQQQLPPLQVTVPAFTSGNFDNNLMELQPGHDPRLQWIRRKRRVYKPPCTARVPSGTWRERQSPTQHPRGQSGRYRLGAGARGCSAGRRRSQLRQQRACPESDMSVERRDGRWLPGAAARGAIALAASACFIASPPRRPARTRRRPVRRPTCISSERGALS